LLANTDSAISLWELNDEMKWPMNWKCGLQFLRYYRLYH